MKYRQVAVAISALIASSYVQADPVDLSGWTAEDYPAVSGFSDGDWQLAADNLSVTQVVNGQPTIFYSGFSAFGTTLTGRIQGGSGDNDYLGFVLGFNPGDSTNANADYLLVDWKQGTQAFNFGAPSDTTPGSTAFEGLAVSRVSGIPTADEFWGHVDFAQNPGGGLTELARALTLFDTGWVDNQTYEFTFEITPSSVTIFVDGVLEFDIAGDFSDGRWGFYNFSQANVNYSSFSVATADSDDDGLLDTDDNCQFVANPVQRDSDADGIGNFCDGDLNNDCIVNTLDLGLFKGVFFSTDADADFDGNGVVNAVDLGLLRTFFFLPPGPSGLVDLCDP